MITAQQLMDALNFLDDDLIDETNDLRSTECHKKPQWVRWVGAAACLSMVLFSLFTYRWMRPTPDGETVQPTDAIPGSPGDIDAAGPLEEVDGAAPSSITATILQWEENGFAASVVTSNQPLLKTGQQVHIILGEGAAFQPEKLPIDSSVIITFYDLAEDPQDHSFTVYAEKIIPMIEEEN